ncbi:MAG: hypothetical protein ABW321_07350, partial [Polyangiales bacterium]
PGEHPSYDDVQQAASRGRVYYPLGFALLGVGLAGVAVGCGWQLWPEAPRRESARLAIGPGGLALSGAF